jgi:hypothetical protein
VNYTSGTRPDGVTFYYGIFLNKAFSSRERCEREQMVVPFDAAEPGGGERSRPALCRQGIDHATGAARQIKPAVAPGHGGAADVGDLGGGEEFTFGRVPEGGEVAARRSARRRALMQLGGTRHSIYL